MKPESIATARSTINRADKVLSQSKLGITSVQFIVLVYVAQRHPTHATLGEIAQHLKVSPAVVTGLVDKLEKRKAVIRQATKDDRRVLHILPTRGGLDLLVAATSALEAA